MPITLMGRSHISALSRVLPMVLLATTLVACSPALNWREVRFDAALLTALLPCKPDRAQRTMPLAAGGPGYAVQMIGCEVSSHTYAIARIHLAQPADAGAVLLQWQQATQSGMQGEIAARQAFVPHGALALVPSQRWTVNGRSADGGTAVADIAWFAQLSAQGADLYQVLVLGAALPVADVRDSLFSGLRLQSP